MILGLIYFDLFSLGNHPSSMPGKAHVNTAQWPLTVKGQESLSATPLGKNPGRVRN